MKVLLSSRKKSQIFYNFNYYSKLDEGHSKIGAQLGGGQGARALPAFHIVEDMSLHKGATHVLSHSSYNKYTCPSPKLHGLNFDGSIRTSGADLLRNTRGAAF